MDEERKDEENHFCLILRDLNFPGLRSNLQVGGPNGEAELYGRLCQSFLRLPEQYSIVIGHRRGTDLHQQVTRPAEEFLSVVRRTEVP